MTRLLVVAGTADAAEFVAAQPPETEILATTFSRLGADCLAPRPGLRLHTGALDAAAFQRLLAAEQPDWLVDLSHPFAVEVSQNARAAAAACNVPYLRYERLSVAEEGAWGDVRRLPDFAAAAAACREIDGNILLTIGSKNLHYFTGLPDFHQRFYLRVLAESRILQELEAMQIAPDHIFAMKGVAGVELNIALARQCKAAAIVSKDSGAAGGLHEKMWAAAELQIPLLLVDRPAKAQEPAAGVFHSLADLNRKIYQN